MRRTVLVVVGLTCAILALRGVGWAYGRSAGALYEGDRAAQASLAQGVDRWVQEDLGRDRFSTGSSRFDGEWLFATRMMAVLGYAQVARAHPELADRFAPRIDACLEVLVSERARAFDREAWGTDPFGDLGTDRAHVAYLGYLALALAAAEAVHPQTPHAPLLPRIVAHLAPLLEASPLGLLETYPGERYPIDNSSFVGALGLYDRVHGEDHGALIARFGAGLEARYRDPASGLLTQSVDARGEVVDGPRGSGTALAAYFLSFADPALSRRLWRAVRRLAGTTLGFGTTREYPLGVDGRGDIDSGPVLLGQGLSVTGFSLALARIHGDRDTFVATWATASAVGGRVTRDGTHFALGGPMGDSMLFALATALPAGAWRAP